MNTGRGSLFRVSSALLFATMQINTSHFGPVEISVDDILLFPRGIIAFEDCSHWVLLADDASDALGWLQSVNRPEIALPVVSPRRFVPHYQVRVTRGQLAPLDFSQFDEAYVLSILAQSDGDWTLNLKAPLIINFDRRLGRQVITADEQPVAMEIAPRAPTVLRRSA
ncbi:MAG: flagellar assembly protein FliW [Pirellulaceae bacterium]|nr:flagellar assembly protein FliW [Pirellulaceae bacterium]